jgi:hypothetical protein
MNNPFQKPKLTITPDHMYSFLKHTPSSDGQSFMLYNNHVYFGPGTLTHKQIMEKLNNPELELAKKRKLLITGRYGDYKGSKYLSFWEKNTTDSDIRKILAYYKAPPETIITVAGVAIGNASKFNRNIKYSQKDLKNLNKALALHLMRPEDKMKELKRQNWRPKYSLPGEKSGYFSRLSWAPTSENFKNWIYMKENFEINHGIIALENSKIVHFCGYEEEPTRQDFESLKKELFTNEEFGLAGKTLTFAIATSEIINFYKEITSDNLE